MMMMMIQSQDTVVSFRQERADSTGSRPVLTNACAAYREPCGISLRLAEAFGRESGAAD